MNTICYDEQTRRSMKREATARRYGLKVEAADSCRSLLRLEPFAIQFAKYFSFCTHLQRAQLLLGWCSSCSVGAFLARLVHLRQVHPLSVPPFASAVRSDSVRRPIGFRPPSDQIPFAIRSDSVRSRWKSAGKNVARTLCSSAILSATSPSFT